MEELSRSKASRRGYRSHITKTYSRIAETTDSTEPPTDAQRITLATALEQLQQKQTLLKELDLKIANGIADAEELTEEICDTEEYHTALAEKIAYVREFLSCRHSHPSVSTSPPRPPPPAVIATSRESGVIEITSDAEQKRYLERWTLTQRH